MAFQFGIIEIILGAVAGFMLYIATVERWRPIRTATSPAYSTAKLRKGPEPSLDVISKLKYLNCVVSEALRLLPPVVRLERCGTNDYVLGDTGMKLPSGCTVIIPVYSIHHDPEFFSDPECFRPDRFNEENVGSIHPYTYLPFGAGPRNCIGSRFVLQSIKMCLLHSVHSVEFTKTDKTKKTSLLEYGDGQIDSTDV
ncbi:hypothetical protein HPB52_006236 [Rhipicephalus sanguineus]|uniref:Cytochrome P450 n=1 Tax=Rhipicephalus sanguineus TaxID=34632 RepID=A0A9D4PQD0_RHISA|nr:hypothetical protein HPB52_006236 [Rhipicephalus sanguineus]